VDNVARKPYERTKWDSTVGEEASYSDLEHVAESFYKKSEFSCFEIHNHVVHDNVIERVSVHKLFASKMDVWREYSFKHPSGLKKSKFFTCFPSDMTISKFEKCIYVLG
jgi:hypothetical protein